MLAHVWQSEVGTASRKERPPDEVAELCKELWRMQREKSCLVAVSDATETLSSVLGLF
jgi:hypothetical protein